MSRFDHSFGGWFGPTTGHRHLYKLFLFVLPLTVEKVSTDHQHMWPVYRRPLASLHSRLAEKHPRNVHAEIQKGLCNNYLEGVVGKLKGGHKRKWQRERGGGGVGCKIWYIQGGITFSFLFANWKSSGRVIIVHI